MSGRILIVNADDFGRSDAINGGVIRCHERGIVTSASLMVRWPDAGPAAAYARGSSLSVGLHLDIGEWEYREGEWRAVYEVLAEETAAAARAEVERQLERFQSLVGEAPTHLDSHQRVHLKEPMRSALDEAGERLGVPVRSVTPGIAYEGGFFGQRSSGAPLPERIRVDALVRLVEALPEGVTELGCHPAAAAEHRAVYDAERAVEVETLCDPRVRAAVEAAGVELRSFAELNSRRSARGAAD